MNRYQIITYAADCGAQEKREYARKREAEKFARAYVRIGYDAALVYDLKAGKIVYETGGGFPEKSRPIEGVHRA